MEMEVVIREWEWSTEEGQGDCEAELEYKGVEAW
jgi:hypothetical protein